MTPAQYLACRNAYAYPAVGLNGCLASYAHRTFASIRSMEDHHRALLRSPDDATAVFGYLSVIYWGHYSGQDGVVRGPRSLDPFAKAVGELVGIEIVETSIESAKRNAKDNGIENASFLAKDARKGIDQVLEEFGAPELLLLDPPRSGAGGKVMRRIGRSQPERIVYVSCKSRHLCHRH